MRRRCLRSGWYGSVILCRPFPNVIGAAAEIAPIIAMLSKVLLTSLAFHQPHSAARSSASCHALVTPGRLLVATS